MINGLAHRVANEVLTVTEKNDLYTELVLNLNSDVKQIVKSYLTQRGIVAYNIDSANYESAVMFEGITNALNGYDMNKGDFVARLKRFSGAWLSNQFRKDFSKTSVEFSTKAVSFDMLYESEEFDIEDSTVQVDNLETLTTEKAISNFIKTDKDGQVIAILSSIAGQKDRNSAFTAYFGKYEATERKRVQRVKERLENYLISNGIAI